MVRHYFWDSCVFIAYLNNDSHIYDIDSLSSFIDELGRKNGCIIYTSAIALAEVSPRRLANSEYGSFQDFISDFRGAIRIVPSSPNINITAGLLKDVQYKRQTSNKRVLTTGDAIMLATALELSDAYGVNIDAFHTYDNGRGKGHPEGRGVPLLDYHLWLEGVSRPDVVERVVALDRCRPVHPQPRLIR